MHCGSKVRYISLRIWLWFYFLRVVVNIPIQLNSYTFAMTPSTISLSKSKSFRQKAAKIFNFYAASKRWGQKICTSGYFMMISTLFTQDTTIMAPRFTFDPNPHVQLLLNLNIHHWHSSWLTNKLLFSLHLRLTNTKFWWWQILSRFLVERNKFSQPSALRPERK